MLGPETKILAIKWKRGLKGIGGIRTTEKDKKMTVQTAPGKAEILFLPVQQTIALERGRMLRGA